MKTWVVPYGLVVAVVLAMFFPWWGQGRVLAPLDILTELIEPWASEHHPKEVALADRRIAVHNQFPSDAVTQYLIYRQLMAASLQTEGSIGWQPWILGGYNMRANTMATPFDWTIQLHRWMDFWTAWHLGLAGQFLIAGIGMLHFLRSRGIGNATAVAGAIAFLLNTQFVTWIYHRWALGSFCWMPWLLWAMLSWKDGRKFPGFAVPVFLALGFAGGTLQHAVFIVILVICVWAAWLWEAWDAGTFRSAWIRLTMLFAIWGLAGLLLASPMFISCIAGFFNNTNEGRGAIGYTKGILQPLWHLAGYAANLFPWLFGSPTTIDLNKAFKSDFFNVAFFGTVPVLAGVWALFQRQTPKEARVIGLVGLAIPLTPLVGPLYHRVLLLAIVGGIWAFASWWQNGESSRARRFSRWALGLYCLGLAVWLLLSVGIHWKEREIAGKLAPIVMKRTEENRFGMYRAWMEERVTQFVQESRLWVPAKSLPAVLALAGLVCLLVRVEHPRRALPLAWALAVLITAEGLWFFSGWVTWSPRPVAGVLPPSPTIDRIRQEAASRPLEVVQIKGFPPFLPPNTPAAFGLRMVDGYESIKPPTRIAPNEPRWEVSPTETGKAVNPAAVPTDGEATR